MTLTNPADMTLILEGSQDDDSINIGDIGFDFPFYDGTYRDNIFVGSNSYITFGFGSNNYNNLSHTNPGRSILIAAGDRSYQRVYTLARIGEFHIRFEGSTGTSGTIGSPSIIWEITLFTSGNINVETGIIRDTNGINLITDGVLNYTNYEISTNSTVTIRRQAPGVYTIGGPPTTPTNPVPRSGESNTNTTTTLLWDSNGSSFTLALGQNNPPPIIARELNTASYQVKLAAGTTYFWQVTATNTEGETTSPIWSFTTTPPVPNPPRNLRTTAITSNKVNLAWDAPDNTIINFYVIFRNNLQISPSGSTQYIDRDCDRNTTYTYEVTAHNQSGISGSSNTITVTTPDLAPLDSLLLAKIKLHLALAFILIPSSILTVEYNGGETELIRNQIIKCDLALNSTAPNARNLALSSTEVTDGNITVTTEYPTRWGTSTTTTTYGDRTVTTSKRPSYQQRLSAYYKEVELLAKILGVEL